MDLDIFHFHSLRVCDNIGTKTILDDLSQKWNCVQKLHKILVRNIV